MEPIVYLVPRVNSLLLDQLAKTAQVVNSQIIMVHVNATAVVPVMNHPAFSSMVQPIAQHVRPVHSPLLELVKLAPMVPSLLMMELPNVLHADAVTTHLLLMIIVNHVQMATSQPMTEHVKLVQSLKLRYQEHALVLLVVLELKPMQLKLRVLLV